MHAINTAHRTCRRWRSPERTRRRSEALHWTDQLQNIFVAQAQTERQQERFRDYLAGNKGNTSALFRPVAS